MKGGTIIIGLDDVLVDTSTALYQAIKSDWPRFSPYLVDLGLLDQKHIHSRPLYQFNDWLIRPELRKLPANDYANVQARLIKSIESDFYSQDYLQSARITRFAAGSLLNPKYMASGTVERVWVCSPFIEREKGDAERREAFIARAFPDKKVSPFVYPASQDLKDAIASKRIEWDLLVIDDAAAVRRIAESYRTLSKKEFLMPRYGYNAIPREVEILIEGKGGAINYYDPD
jgi:hypothetical protein